MWELDVEQGCEEDVGVTCVDDVCEGCVDLEVSCSSRELSGLAERRRLRDDLMSLCGECKWL